MTIDLDFSSLLASAAPGSSADDPTTHERRLAALLARGTTDAAVARKLGWSQRTFQRNLKSIMTKVGARSRFQAGYLVARAGWLQDGNDDS